MLEAFAAQPTLQNLFALVNQEVSQALVGHLFTDFVMNDDGQTTGLEFGFLQSLLRQLIERLEQSGRA